MGVRRSGFLGKAFNVIEIHPAKNRIVFVLGDGAVKGGLHAGDGGVLPHQAYQHLAGSKGIADPIQHLQGVFNVTGQDQVANDHAFLQLIPLEHRIAHLSHHFPDGCRCHLEIIRRSGKLPGKVVLGIFQIRQVNIHLSL